MKEAVLTCYPWDLEDEGLDAALGRIAGEMGMDAIAVGASLPRVQQFRPRPISGRRTIVQEAAAYFQPAGSERAAARIRPIPATWMKSRNELERIATAAGRHGLKVRAVVHCLSSLPLVERHPLAGCVDVFGDASPDRLCPSNPDVREYVAAMVEDLAANYPLEAIVLASFGFDGGSGGERAGGLAFDSLTKSLREWCFCPACRHRAAEAGCDVQRVVESVAEHINRTAALESPPAATLNAMLAQDELVASYHRMRSESVTSLVRSVRPRRPVRLALQIDAHNAQDGVEVAALRDHCDAFVTAPMSLAAMAQRGSGAPGERLVANAGGAERVDLSVYCYPPHATDGPSLVTAVHQASQAGHRTICFENYGEAPAPCLDWVRQAVRYARRESL